MVQNSTQLICSPILVKCPMKWHTVTELLIKTVSQNTWPSWHLKYKELDCFWFHSQIVWIGNAFPRCDAISKLVNLFDFDYNSSSLQRLPSGYRRCCNQNIMSDYTLKQNNGGTSSDFPNIKSNRNMPISNWKCSSVHQYRFNHSKWTFST